MINVLLLLATLITTVAAGARQQGVNLLENPELFTAGLPYAIALLSILGVHEMGHYVMARRHGVEVTLPYFIPVPMGLGTFGAFIQIINNWTDANTWFNNFNGTAKPILRQHYDGFDIGGPVYYPRFG